MNGRTDLNRDGSSRQYRFRRREMCELCGSPDALALYEGSFDEDPVRGFLEQYYRGRLDPGTLSEGRYRVMSCPECGFVWQGDVLQDEGLAALYDQWIDADESKQKARQQDTVARARLAHQVSLLGILLNKAPTNITAMDFGMGWGNWCAMARAFGVEVFGAELSETRIAEAAASGLRVLDREDWPSEIDVINTEQVFEHVADPTPVLAMLVEHLSPRGLLRISVPDGRRFLRAHGRERWKPGKDAVHPLEHVNAFTHRSLVRFGARCGLRPVPASRFVAAHARAAAWGGAVSARTVLECLNGHLRGVAIWFQKDHSELGSER